MKVVDSIRSIRYDQLGRYEMLVRIGAGGIGEVYHAGASPTGRHLWNDCFHTGDTLGGQSRTW
jgi:hypothetical protein